MYNEDNFLPLSALQHICFCKRQCALIHVEQVWVENLYTAEGRILHEKADAGRTESRGNVRTASALPLRSLRLGLVGKADMVEFHRRERESGEIQWQPFPVEYKRGRPKKDNCDKIQLCAQAICLEEMLELDIAVGALFYGKTKRRQNIAFDAALRKETEGKAERLHQLISSQITPKPVFDKRCPNCSFISYCLPDKVGKNHSATNYLDRIKKGL